VRSNFSFSMMAFSSKSTLGAAGGRRPPATRDA
jgi:hypothetical protein